MDVKNLTARSIFLGVKDRRLQDVEGIRQGIRFPANATLTVPDALRLSEDFDALVVAGKLAVLAYGTGPTSTVQQEELTGGTSLADLKEVSFTPTAGQVLFVLPAAYKPGGFARAIINTLTYRTPDFFSITGTVFLWTTAKFSLDSDDDLTVWYELA